MFVDNKGLMIGKAYLFTLPSTTVPASLCSFSVVDWRNPQLKKGGRAATGNVK